MNKHILHNYVIINKKILDSGGLATDHNRYSIDPNTRNPPPMTTPFY